MELATAYVQALCNGRLTTLWILRSRRKAKNLQITFIDPRAMKIDIGKGPGPDVLL